MLPGYRDRLPDDLDFDFVDGWPLVRRPGFWNWYLRELLIADEDESLPPIGEGAGEEPDDLFDPEAWPVMRMPLPGGGELAVVFRNLEEDGGVDFLVLPADGGDSIGIAALDGHQTGPGFSWPELVAVSAHQPGPVRQAEALLLLAPAFGDVAAGNPEAVAVFAEALRVLGATGEVERMAAAMVSDEVQFWGHVRWADGVPDCEYAPRNPASVFALPEESRLYVSVCLR